MATRPQKFTRYEKRWLVLWGGCCLLLGLLVIGWQRINADPVVSIPTPTMPSPNAYDYYVRAGAALVPGSAAVDPYYDRQRPRTPLSEQESARRYPWSVKHAWLQQNAQALSLLRQGFHYPYLEPPARPPASGFPAFGRFRELARLLVVESHAYSQQGDWRSASHSALDAMKLGHDTARGGTLISALVSNTIQAIGDHEVWRIMPHLDPLAAHAAATRLESLEAHRVPFADTMQTEKWYGLTEMLQQMRAGKWRSGVGSMLSFRQNFPQKLSIWLTPNRTVVDNYTRMMNAIIANARWPYTKTQPLPPPGDPYTAVMAPLFSNARWDDARTETRNVLLLVALALRAYHLERGAYPEQLGALVPLYLKRVPNDPFGGDEPLHYRRHDETYLLWSIGSDGVDNGGQPVNNPVANPNSAHTLMPDSKGDVVAGVNR